MSVEYYRKRLIDLRADVAKGREIERTKDSLARERAAAKRK